MAALTAFGINPAQREGAQSEPRHRMFHVKHVAAQLKQESLS